MKIFVYDLAAEDGGGLQVLRSFYNDAVRESPSNIDWVFLVSAPDLSSADRVKVIRRNKGALVSRLRFELTELPKIVRQFHPDLIISLQNMPLFHCRQPQYVYLHQSLQYCEERFSLIKSTERSLAFRQRFICGLYRRTLPKAAHIFVQTEWIRDATLKWLKKYRAENISVVPVRIDAEDVSFLPYVGGSSRTFFYPARAELYKNHETVIKACRILEASGLRDYHVIFTVRGNENACSAELARKAEGLPVDFIGSVPYEEMWRRYSRSILVFPSYLETCGLPLIEAKLAGAKIIAADLPFAHEALDGYENVRFFPYSDAEALAAAMREMPDAPYYPMDRTGSTPGESASLMHAMLNRFAGDRQNEKSTADHLLS